MVSQGPHSGAERSGFEFSRPKAGTSVTEHDTGITCKRCQRGPSQGPMSLACVIT